MKLFERHPKLTTKLSQAVLKLDVFSSLKENCQHSLFERNSWQFSFIIHTQLHKAQSFADYRKQEYQGVGGTINAKSPRPGADKSAWPGALVQKLAATDSPTGE
ncbi:hypothetical protein, partial [Hymenobacter sp. UV11]